MTACVYCGAQVGFGQTRCNNETCYLRRIGELEAALSAATARASELEKLLAAKWGLSCAECGAQWMHDAALDELSDLVEARVAKRDAELAAMTARVSELEGKLAEALEKAR